MKKFYCIFLVLLLLIGTAALAEGWVCPSCGNQATGNFCNNCGNAKPVVIEEDSGSLSQEQVISDEGYLITKEYSWSTRYDHYAAIALKNTSGSKCSFDIQVLFYDGSNNIVGVSNQTIGACDPDYEVLVTAQNDVAFDHAEFSITLNEALYNDVHSYVAVTAQKAGKKAIITAVNNGNVNAEFVEYRCLFLNEQKQVVGSSWGYIVDKDNQLKAGKKELREATCSTEFSYVEVYFRGRTTKSVVNSGTTVDVTGSALSTSEDYEVTKSYSWTLYYNYFAIVLKNTSGKALGYEAQFIFYDSSNNMVGVSRTSVNVCDNGYEVLLTGASNAAFDHVEYTITSKNPYYNDVHAYVNVTAQKVGNKAIITAVNTGTVDAEYVKYHCLFLDDQQKVVGISEGYAVDSSGKLQSGKTELREDTCSKDFSSIQVYFEGRTDISVINTGTVDMGATSASENQSYEVIHEYKWNTGWYHYFAIVIKNTSGSACAYDAQFIFYDADNKTIGVANPRVDVCDDGFEVVFVASSNVEFDHADYNIAPKEAMYNDIHSFVNVTAQKVGDKAIITAVNTGTVDADFVEYYCLFLNDQQQVVGSASGYPLDNEYELKSGRNEMREETCSEEFTSILVYYEGRTSKSVVNSGTIDPGIPSASAAVEGCEVIHEYSWSTRWSNYFAMVIKNTSGKTCGFNAQIVFYDESNTIIGVSNPSISVCGDGYETIMVASQKTAFDHISYRLTPVYTGFIDVHSFVDVTAQISGNKAIITGKNNGETSAEFVHYICLFLKNEQVVALESGYLMDGESAIKPGNTEIREANTNESFDSVAIYFEGRCK